MTRLLLGLIGMHVCLDCSVENMSIKPNKRVSVHWLSTCDGVTALNSSTWYIFSIAYKKSIFLGNSFMQHNVLNPSNGSINPINSWNKFVFAIFQTKFKYFVIQNQVLSVRKTTLKWNEPCAWIQCNDPSQVDSNGLMTHHRWTANGLRPLLLGLIDMFSTCNKGKHACQSNLTWSLRGESHDSCLNKLDNFSIVF